MASTSKMVVNYKSMEEGELLKIGVGDSEKGKYITLPLSYDLEFSPVDDKGNNIPITSIALKGTDAIIRTPVSTALLELTITRLKDRSNTDPTGVPVTVDPPESGNSDNPGNGEFIDWIYKEAKEVNKDLEARFQGARRRIFFLQDEGL